MRYDTKKALGRALSALVLLFGAASAAADVTCGEACLLQFAAAREGTAKYNDVSVATQDGYLPHGECVASPLGTMGIHYVNVPLASNLDVDPARPEVVLYLPLPNGHLRLIGVEYIVPVLSNGGPWFGGELVEPAAGAMAGFAFRDLLDTVPNVSVTAADRQPCATASCSARSAAPRGRPCAS